MSSVTKVEDCSRCTAAARRRTRRASPGLRRNSLRSSARESRSAERKLRSRAARWSGMGPQDTSENWKGRSPSGAKAPDSCSRFRDAAARKLRHGPGQADAGFHLAQGIEDGSGDAAHAQAVLLLVHGVALVADALQLAQQARGHGDGLGRALG